jgi:hypothetical protein
LAHPPLARRLFAPALLSFVQELDSSSASALFEGLTAAMAGSKSFKQVSLVKRLF